MVCPGWNERLSVEYRCNYPLHKREYVGHLYSNHHGCEWMYFFLQPVLHRESESCMFHHRPCDSMCRWKRYLVRPVRNERLPMEHRSNDTLHQPDHFGHLYSDHHRCQRLYFFLQPDLHR